MKDTTGLRKLTESALCVAAAVALSTITLFRMPLGGSVTPFATLPIIVISLRHNAKWGVSAALVFSLTQCMLGVSSIQAVPVRSGLYVMLCILLDYVLAYTAIGFTGTLSRVLGGKRPGLSAAVGLTGLARLACSFISGVLVWASFTPEGWNVAVYSLAYNALWCLPDVGIALFACLALTRVKTLGLTRP